ncbi:hypothetical protein HWV62_35762 [Athelia sp. TMB]|nr:hypothetical protein HWV62_35762 [Athelia sp. TMB]
MLLAPRNDPTDLWAHNQQGTAFQELVVKPTFAPHLARPYEMPGIYPRPRLYNGEDPADRDAQQEYTPQDAPAAPQVEIAAPAIESHQFILNATMEWSERSRGPRSNTKSKKVAESKLSSQPYGVTVMTRKEIILAALTAHQFENINSVGAIGGPPFKIHWSGSVGGKARAVTVFSDNKWESVQLLLARAKRAVDTICLDFDLDAMDGFRNRKRGLSPVASDPYDEITFGTLVPRTDMFTPEQVAVAEAIKAIKSEWTCDAHGICYINPNGEHVQMNHIRLSAWGSGVVAGRCKPDGPPSADLLAAWTSGRPASTSRARGRTGPHPEAPATSSQPPPATDYAALLLQAIPALVGAFASNSGRNTNITQTTSATLTVPAENINWNSSPPPSLEDELEKCLQAFSLARGVSEDALATALSNLRRADYSPDAICEADIGHLRELSHLSEGQVLALKKFCCQWCGKMDVKRAKAV